MFWWKKSSCCANRKPFIAFAKAAAKPSPVTSRHSESFSAPLSITRACRLNPLPRELGCILGEEFSCRSTPAHAPVSRGHRQLPYLSPA
jgi:hypothetical protein